MWIWKEWVYNVSLTFSYKHFPLLQHLGPLLPLHASTVLIPLSDGNCIKTKLFPDRSLLDTDQSRLYSTQTHSTLHHFWMIEKPADISHITEAITQNKWDFWQTFWHTWCLTFLLKYDFGCYRGAWQILAVESLKKGIWLTPLFGMRGGGDYWPWEMST